MEFTEIYRFSRSATQNFIPRPPMVTDIFERLRATFQEIPSYAPE